MSLKTYFSQHRGEWKGPLMAITAAVFYGFIPAFTLPIHGSDSGNAEAMSNPPYFSTVFSVRPSCWDFTCS